eukprot:scaffold4212_cov52-Attheya_sp.AAC.1
MRWSVRVRWVFVLVVMLEDPVEAFSASHGTCHDVRLLRPYASYRSYVPEGAPSSVVQRSTFVSSSLGSSSSSRSSRPRHPISVLPTGRCNMPLLTILSLSNNDDNENRKNEEEERRKQKKNQPRGKIENNTGNNNKSNNNNNKASNNGNENKNNDNKEATRKKAAFHATGALGRKKVKTKRRGRRMTTRWSNEPMSGANNIKADTTNTTSPYSRLLPPLPSSLNGDGGDKPDRDDRMQTRMGRQGGGNERNPTRLPPPLPPIGSKEPNSKNDDSRSTPLSSWGEFFQNNSGDGPLGTKKGIIESSFPNRSQTMSGDEKNPSFHPRSRFPNKSAGDVSANSQGSDTSTSQLPQISDLFPPDFGTLPPRSAGGSDSSNSSVFTPASSSSKASQSPVLDGVLPVSELFYRSSQSMATDDTMETSFVAPNGSDEDGDDEELPFSAEQSDNISTNGNKVRIRRNNAPLQNSGSSSGSRNDGPSSSESTKKKSKRKKSSDNNDSSKKMIRRGIYMLVDGVPINADPPQRVVELSYDRLLAGTPSEWSRTITMNSRDFGPLLHTDSSAKVTEIEKGLFCEHFVAASMKWVICPKYLRDIVKGRDNVEKTNASLAATYDTLLDKVASVSTDVTRESEHTDENAASDSSEDVDSDEKNRAGESLSPFKTLNEDTNDDRGRNNGRGFGESSTTRKKNRKRKKREKHSVLQFGGSTGGANRAFGAQSDSSKFNLEVNIVLTIGVTQSELESGHGGSGKAFRNVLSRAMSLVMRDAELGFDLEIETKKVSFAKVDGGSTTDVSIAFNMVSRVPMLHGSMEKERTKINKAIERAMEEGNMTLAMAASAREEKGWSANVRDRIVEEMLLMTKHVLEVEFMLTIGVTRSELESGHGGPGKAFRNVLSRGMSSAIRAEELGFSVETKMLTFTKVEGGSTGVSVVFNMVNRVPMLLDGNMENQSKKVNKAITRAMDNGDMALAMAASAREEKGWSAKVRDRIVEEMLFDNDDDLDENIISDDDSDTDSEKLSNDENVSPTAASPTGSSLFASDNSDAYDGPFGVAGSEPVYHQNDLFLGGGNGGVFSDYSEDNIASAPFEGTLGPLLKDAVTERAIQRKPRVIAIGDVHGCIDELQSLLRKCDYSPGDLVVFLGDLVSKGPDSVSVIQMAREIGAIGVRGNHDFEVIRWHQAMKSGVDAPVFGSEHFHIASCLSNADMKWMYSLPWYISSKELGALFVHAGFVSGIRLAKQNPRLMMNMRSILPDGTVTSKFFNNWPWARLWDGPQTVLFGHDADRGLQQYEHAIGLDTGCVYGGRLTACILPEKRLVSVSANREYFKYRRKHYD